MLDKGYYYLKLKENFFDTDEMKILESMENGYLYSNILLKLYLKALKNEGRLTFNEYIPYDTKMLATITGHNVDIVEKAIKIFQGMHLIDVLDNGTIYMLDMQKMIGSISSEGVRKAEYRERIKLEKKQEGTKLGQCPDIISISNSNNINNIINKEEDEEEDSGKKRFKPPTLEEVKEYAKKRDMLSLAQTFYEFFTEGKWVDSNGKKVKNWKQKFITWCSYRNQVKDKNFKGREYEKGEMNALFTDIDDVKI